MLFFAHFTHFFACIHVCEKKRLDFMQLGMKKNRGAAEHIMFCAYNLSHLPQDKDLWTFDHHRQN